MFGGFGEDPAGDNSGDGFIGSDFVNVIQVAELKAISMHSSRNIDWGVIHGLCASAIEFTKFKLCSPVDKMKSHYSA